MEEMIPFNKPYLSGNETSYIAQAVKSGKISGNGDFTKKCQQFFQEQYGFRKCLLTTSCTDALEMAAILLNIQAGDEVIMPAYTFVSTANAFVLRGAKIVFIDSMFNHPNMDVDRIEELVTDKTKAIVVVHYAGVGCDMDKVMALSEKYGLFVVEDAAQAVDSTYKDRPLGSIGHLSAFSFHETKNIISGEGGMLVVNDKRFESRAEIIWEKGTNRSAFFRGEVDKYGWVDIGSSFLPSEVISAFLFAQLENLNDIQQKRKMIWEQYHSELSVLNELGVGTPVSLEGTTNNAHMYYIVCNSLDERNDLIDYLKQLKVHAVFHYLGLHKSKFYQEIHDGRVLTNSDKYEERLLRLPLFYELRESQIKHIINSVLSFYK